jgi:hypothetical protein
MSLLMASTKGVTNNRVTLPFIALSVGEILA